MTLVGWIGWVERGGIVHHLEAAPGAQPVRVRLAPVDSARLTLYPPGGEPLQLSIFVVNEPREGGHGFCRFDVLAVRFLAAAR